MTTRRRRALLPWKDRSARPHVLHAMMSRAGSMPPGLAGYLVEAYSRPGDLVLDPFCGKGTVPLEASLRKRNAIGFDVAPDAVAVANAKLDPPSAESVERYIKTLVTDCGTRSDGLFRSVPWQVKVFFSPRTLSQLLTVRYQLLRDVGRGNEEVRRTANFVLGTLLGMLHGHSKLSLSLPSSHSFAMAPHYVLAYARRFGLRRPHRDVRKCLLARAAQLLSREAPPVRGEAFLRSADAYGTVHGMDLSNSVDLVVTSPPYLNMQTYRKDAWLRLWLLGYDHRSLAHLFIETGSPARYHQRMRPCLEEMLRVLKPSGRAVVVAGDAPVRNQTDRRLFRTAHELGELATAITISGSSFQIESEIVDRIPAHARYYHPVHKDGNAGIGPRKGVVVERIIVLRKISLRSNRTCVRA